MISVPSMFVCLRHGISLAGVRGRVHAQHVLARDAGFGEPWCSTQFGEC